MFILYVWKVQTQLKEWPMKYWLRSLYTDLITHVGETPLKDWLCCPWRTMPESINFNSKKNWPRLQGLSQSPQAKGWQETSSICCRILSSAVYTELLLPQEPTSMKTSCCKGQPAGSGCLSVHSWEPSRNSSTLVVPLWLYLTNASEWAKVTAENGQSCLGELKGDGGLVGSQIRQVSKIPNVGCLKYHWQILTGLTRAVLCLIFNTWKKEDFLLGRIVYSIPLMAKLKSMTLLFSCVIFRAI